MTKIYLTEESSVFLCVRCFSSGSEKIPAARTEKFHVIDNLNFPLVNSQWTAHDELLLLDGLAKFGFGNWADVSQQVGTKNKEECEKHYMNFWFKKGTEFDSISLLSKRISPDEKIVVGESEEEEEMEEAD